MSSANYFFTSESVTEGHPDKVADQISDCYSGCHFDGRPQIPGRLRDPGHHRPGLDRRGDHHHLLCGYAGDRPGNHQGNRV